MSLSNVFNLLMDPNKRSRNAGLYGSWGGDPNGNNEIGRMFKDLSAAWYPVAASRVGFASEQEGARQNYLRQLLASLTPEGLQTTADHARAGLEGHAMDENRMLDAAAGPSAGIGQLQGNKVASINHAHRAANDLLTHMASPEGKAQINDLYNQAFGQTQDLGLGPLQSMFGPIEQRYSQNQADHQAGAFGGMLPILGQLAGNYLPMPRFRGSGGSGGGSGSGSTFGFGGSGGSGTNWGESNGGGSGGGSWGGWNYGSGSPSW